MEQYMYKYLCMKYTIDNSIEDADGQFLPSPKLRSKNNPRSTTLSKNRKMAKPTPRTSFQPVDDKKTTNIVKFGNRNYKKVEMIPRNIAQETYVEALLEKRMVFAVGPAGTGKTLLAVLRAIKALRENEVTKIILTRPAVSVDEKHGFLPGDLNAKMEPWVRPIFDVFEEYYGLQETKRMLDDGVIEIAPLGFMRGRTFKYSYIIADEMQNATPDQTKMLLTRIGIGSSMVITGDLRQHDRGFDQNGLKDFLERLASSRMDTMVVCKFERQHIERDPLVADVLEIYGEED